MKKTTQLKNMLLSKELEFLMEAHNGLSARIVEEAGFKGIWASGLSISASLGVRDNNEASWTQVVDVVEFMSDATSVPILIDGDTGYGNFNNMRRLVRKLEQRGVAGVCIEDKIFPKTNSFLRDGCQPLADADEFAGKIAAAKDAQDDEDFVVVARVEGFIAGWGLAETLNRAEKYRQAGADAILVHSKKTSAEEVDSFMAEWGDRHPIVIVPTKYYSTPTEHFEQIGISLVIWANHNLRATIKAQQEISKQIFEERTLINVEDTIVPVSEVFRLQRDQELKELEKSYLPTANKSVNAIVLAAAQGSRLGELTKTKPKALLPIGGKSILSTLVDDFNAAGLRDIAVVRGFGKEQIDLPGIATVDNDEHADTKALYSLYLARHYIGEDTIVAYGDIVFRHYVLLALLNDDADVSLIADARVPEGDDYFEYIQTNIRAENWYDEKAVLTKMPPAVPLKEATGEFIGLCRFRGEGAVAAREVLEELGKTDDIRKMVMSDLFTALMERTEVSVKFITGSWVDVDSVVTLQEATQF